MQKHGIAVAFLSVCPSVKRVYRNKTKETSADKKNGWWGQGRLSLLKLWSKSPNTPFPPYTFFPFPSKIALQLKKVCYKVFYMNTISDRVVRHSLEYLTVQKWFAGTSTTT